MASVTTAHRHHVSDARSCQLISVHLSLYLVPESTVHQLEDRLQITHGLGNALDWACRIRVVA
jgi:hypothetical protein